MSPDFKPLMKNAVTRLCMVLNEKDLEIISNILGQKVIFSMNFKKLFTHISANIYDLENVLPYAYNFIDITVYRNCEYAEVTIWN